MNFDLGSQNLLITIILAVIALGFALLGRRLLGEKPARVHIPAIVLLVLLIFPLDLIRTSLALNYYGLLCTEALFGFAVFECPLIAACSSWLEWFSPPPQWKTRAYRENSIFNGVCLTIGSVGLMLLFLPKVAAIIPDMVTGPSIEEGIVEQMTLRQVKMQVSGGDFVVQGVSYFTADLRWYNTLSVGRSVRFAYSPHSHYGFPADQVILTPLGVAFPALIVGAILLFFSAGYHFLKPSNSPTDQVSNEERNPFEQITDSVAGYRQAKGVGPFILLMILPLLLFGMILLMLVSR